MTATSPPTGSFSKERLSDRIAEEFVEQLRGGEQPDPSEYARRYPHVADQLRCHLKTVQKLEPAGSSHRQKQPPREEIEAKTTDLRIIERIGTRGMGSIWKATQLSLDRLVAVEVLHHLDWTQSRQRLLEEARIASSLSHEHILPLHDVFPEAQRPYFVMQFIAGCSLSQVISAWKKQRNGEDPAAAPGSAFTPGAELDTLPYRHGQCTSVPPRSRRQIAAWMQQAAAAVNFAHQNNVLHRDLKPSNFIIDEKQKIWLTDFGLAKRPQHTTMFLPGQSDGHATTLSNVYSLGVTLYEMLALQPAFTSHSTRSLQQQISACSRSSLRSHDPGIPRDLTVITPKVLPLPPEDSYQSTAALAEDLQRFLDGRPILARPVSAPEQLWRLIARHKLVSAISALATILLVSTSAIAIYSEVLRINELESEIGKLLSEANSIANSSIPEQRTEGITKLRQPEELAAQPNRKAELIQTLRDNAAAVVSALKMLVSEPIHECVSLNAFVISCNERRVEVAAEKNVLDVHDGSGTQLTQISFANEVDKFELSFEGSRLVVNTVAPELTCWDLTAAKPILLWKIPHLQATAFTFLPDEKQVAAADPDGSILLLDQHAIGLTQLHTIGGNLPLAITLQVPLRSQSLSGRLCRWLLLAESPFLGRTHFDVILKTCNGL